MPIVDMFSGEPKNSQAPDSNNDDFVKEFSAFADQIIHLPTVEAYAALQTEESIGILAKMKVYSGNKERATNLCQSQRATARDAQT
jgi:hypothetical protein